MRSWRSSAQSPAMAPRLTQSKGQSPCEGPRSSLRCLPLPPPPHCLSAYLPPTTPAPGLLATPQAYEQAPTSGPLHMLFTSPETNALLSYIHMAAPSPVSELYSNVPFPDILFKISPPAPSPSLVLSLPLICLIFLCTVITS